MEFDAALPTFFAESRELLESMEEALLRIEQSPDDVDTLNALFRVAHTIKGSAGLFGLNDIVAFTHVAESVLDTVRSGVLRIDAKLVALLLASRDHLSILLDSAAEDHDLDADVREKGCELIAQLNVYLGVEAAPVEMRKQL